MSERRERELVLAPNEYAYVLDTTKGHVNIYVGPFKTSLAQTDQPVIFNERTKKFEYVDMDEATRLFITAPANWYAILKNPAADARHPNTGAASNLPELVVGKKINIHGPVSFSLWPGQMAKVIQGHTLQSNQYLLARIYDADEANQNKAQVLGGVNGESGTEEEKVTDFENGQKIVIKGTDVSFYMPPTGVEIVPDCDGCYIRNAVTLQRLEYCILVSENGEKCYIRGEAVVFPRPDQEFVVKENNRKFRAIELSETTGLYIKVIEPYDEGGTKHLEGEELFITGKDKIYFPRREHAIIRYGEHDVHYAVAIPRGEGRYVLNRQTGEVSLVRGPRMFLPDPRTEVITQRILTDRECELMYPGNKDVLGHNHKMRGVVEQAATGGGLLGDSAAEVISKARTKSRSAALDGLVAYNAMAPAAAAAEGWAGDEFSRHKEHTKPRMVTLDTRYEGAVSIDVWSGFALMTVDKGGGRQVIVGPQNGVLLAYDETVEALNLSTGKPKNTDKLKKTAFLKVRNNYVTDQIGVITSDMVMVQIKAKYLVDFEGDDPTKWFAVDNYVKLLCDRGRSMIKAVARKTKIADLQAKVSEIIRDTILGVPGDGKNSRPGMVFEENSMHVRDVDVLYFEITTKEVSKPMFEAQTEAVKAAIEVSQKESLLENQRRLESVERSLLEEQFETAKLRSKLDEERRRMTAQTRELELALANELDRMRQDAQLESETRRQEIEGKALEIDAAKTAADISRRKSLQDLALADLKERVQAVVAQATAFSPELTSALNRLGDTQLLSALANNFGELAAVEGKGLLQMARKYLDFGTMVRTLPGLREPETQDADG